MEYSNENNGNNNEVEILKDRYFNEWLTSPINKNYELMNWEVGEEYVRDLCLTDQSKYADHMTRKLCENHPNLIDSIVEQSVISLKNCIKLNCCLIGNIAYTLVTAKKLNCDTGELEELFNYLIVDDY